MSYTDAIESTVTRDQARREIAAHHCQWAEFIAECGDRDEYAGADVLGWLGY
jgi:hypothetical protein